VAARRAAADRIAADVDRVAAKFVPFGGDLSAEVDGIAPEREEELDGKLAAAAGVPAVADALRSARELRAADFVGWPVGWLVQRLAGRDPLRKVRLGMLWNDLRSISAGPSGAQQAEIDLALTELGDRLADPLPKPWSQTVRSAVRGQADQIPAAIGAALSESLPAEKTARGWWWFGDLWQGLLAGCAGLGLVWLVLVPILHATGARAGGLQALNRLSLLPVIAAGVLVALGLGWLTERLCMRVVRRVAEREREHVAAQMRDQIGAVSRTMVIIPARQELSEFERYREELKIAARPRDLEAARQPAR
jgi:F0F1-type ATP synthase assembly protein I